MRIAKTVISRLTVIPRKSKLPEKILFVILFVCAACKQDHPVCQAHTKTKGNKSLKKEPVLSAHVRSGSYRSELQTGT